MPVTISLWIVTCNYIPNYTVLLLRSAWLHLWVGCKCIIFYKYSVKSVFLLENIGELYCICDYGRMLFFLKLLPLQIPKLSVYIYVVCNHQIIFYCVNRKKIIWLFCFHCCWLCHLLFNWCFYTTLSFIVHLDSIFHVNGTGNYNWRISHVFIEDS